MHNQDVLLADRLGQLLTNCGYRERDPLAPLSPPSTLRMPLAPVALSTVTVSKPSASVAVHVMMPVATPAPATIVFPDLDGHATHATFFEELEMGEDVDMEVDLSERPERPPSPVARCLEPTDENDAPLSAVGAAEPSIRQPLAPLSFGPSSSESSMGLSPLQQHNIVAPIPIPSPPPVSPFARNSLSSSQRVLSPSQLVATLVLRHRDKMAARSRAYSPVGYSSGMRRRSPLARELYV
jgi:hypothetical protein